MTANSLTGFVSNTDPLLAGALIRANAFIKFAERGDAERAQIQMLIDEIRAESENTESPDRHLCFVMLTAFAIATGKVIDARTRHY